MSKITEYTLNDFIGLLEYYMTVHGLSKDEIERLFEIFMETT